MMLLRMTNPSVSMTSFVSDDTVQWSDTIPTWNVQLLVGIHLTLFPIQHSHSTKLQSESDHGSELFHFYYCQGLGEQICWVFFSSDMEGFNDSFIKLFPNVVVSNIDVFCSTFHRRIYGKKNCHLIVWEKWCWSMWWVPYLPAEGS